MDIEQLYSLFLHCTGVTTDSREVEKGNIFFALKGPNYNGNQYASQAIDNGASHAVIDDAEFKNEKTILVSDALVTLQQLASFHRDHFNIPLIAITGSNGKTTTKDLMYTLLSSKYRLLRTEGNLNNHIGVPLTLLKLNSSHEFAIIEMGANHIGEIASYCRWARPGYGIITNIAKAHLEGFGGFEGVIKAKSELYDHLRMTSSLAFVPSEEQILTELSSGMKRLTYGNNDGDYLKVEYISSDPFVSFYYLFEGKKIQVNSGLYGKYNLQNLAAAVCIAKYFKVEDDQIRQRLADFRIENNRSQILQKGSNKLIMDAYNANPSSMKAAIDQFQSMKSKNKMVILGDMFELGEHTRQEHKAIVDLVSSCNFDEAVFAGEIFYLLAKELNFKAFKTTRELKEWIKDQKISNTDILIKGSRGMKLEEIADVMI